MKAYPLIYSRTKNDDFVPDFLTRPADLDCQTALKYTTSAIANLDTLNGIRYSIFSVGDYCICGISCITKTLVNQLAGELNSEIIDKANNYLKDCKGRNIVAFIGLAVPKSEVRNGGIPDIKLPEYWTVYQEYLSHQWEKPHTESEKLSSPTVTLNEKTYSSLHKPVVEMVQPKYVVKDFHGAEQATLDYFLDRIMNHGENVSFISDVTYKSDWDKMYFTYAYVSDTLYKSIISSTKHEVKTETSRPTVQTGSTGTQQSLYAQMMSGSNNSQSNTPAPQEKPLDLDNKSELGGSKKNMGIFGRFIGAGVDNSYNPPETRCTDRSSLYYEERIYDSLRKYGKYVNWSDNRKLCTISMRKSPNLYEFICKNEFSMRLAKQVGYRYISRIIFVTDNQEIIIIFK
ncbi:MAG: hypothetical protein NC548_39095 [Lachnospiraceae bacterium]|nr:hypothetical protein [Lachnospiraceae bacterium]